MPEPVPPRPERRPVILRHHGDERVDDWYWLRDRDDPAVRAHLEAENAYTEAVLAPVATLRARIFEEIKHRIEETDTSAPVPFGQFEYYTRTVEGLQYEIHCRRPRGGDAEQVLLDENEAASGHDFYALGVFAVSPDHRILAVAEDTTGGERHTLRFRELATGTSLPDVVANVSYGFAWADDNRTCFYVRPDDAVRPWQVWRHTLGGDPGDDVLVFQEDDDRFFVHVRRTRSGRYVVIDSSSKTTSEARIIPTNDPSTDPRVVAPRVDGEEYDVEHRHHPTRGDDFLIVTNARGATNFKLVAAPVETPDRAHWLEVVPHRSDVRLEDVDAFAEHVVLTERSEGLTVLRVLDPTTHVSRTLPFADPVYSAGLGSNPEYETDVVRTWYTSLVAPLTDLDHDSRDGRATVVKVQPVRGYEPDAYTSTRAWVEAPDGAKVPLSIVHRREVELDGSAPALLYGYGAYEQSIDATFRPSRLSLLDRGFVYAIAHVRGGGELGRPWYEQGRREHKRNTFTDFIACAEYLVDHRYTSPARLAAMGGSAGGFLMGAVMNLRPELFAAVVAEVPFVDVLTTMLDPELPLTITEWDEWGNPATPEAYAWIKGISPYDNVRAAAYPAVLATTGMHDPRVQYWEPAKWVAKLRDHTTSAKPVLLHTELDAGHGGPSGRYDAWREHAMVLAFVCQAVGISE